MPGPLAVGNGRRMRWANSYRVAIKGGVVGTERQSIYSIVMSARNSNSLGILMPSAAAVRRLIVMGN